MSQIVEGGMGKLSRGGKLNELCVKTIEGISHFNIRGGHLGVQANILWYCIMSGDAVNVFIHP